MGSGVARTSGPRAKSLEGDLAAGDRYIDQTVVHEDVVVFAGGERTGLKIRGQVAIPTDGADAPLVMNLSHETWAEILSGRTTVWEAEEKSLVSLQGDRARVRSFLGAFDHPGLR